MKEVKLTKEELDVIEADAYAKGYEDGRDNPRFTMVSSVSDDEATNDKITKEMKE